MKQKSVVRGWDYLCLALLAFAGLGLEMVLAFFLEPALYGAPMQEWSVGQGILHWIITCILWGLVITFLIKRARKQCHFDLFAVKAKVSLWRWIVVFLCMAFMLTVSYFDWNGLKLVKEFRANGWLRFIFQYIYYIFETGLFTLILVFAQKAFEKWFKKENFPYGGVVVAITWGLGHIFTKDIKTGVLTAFSGLIFGAVYLLVNRDIRKAFPVILIMFVF